MAVTVTATQPRGPEHHEMRGRILAAAEARFRRNGYGRTTVADIAGDVRVSTAYIYKFFPSKLAICEGVCGEILTRIDAELWRVARAETPAPRRLERLYQTLLSESVALLFNDRQLHDMVTEAMEYRWSSVERHRDAMRNAAEAIVADGRAEGAFETETPLQEAAAAIFSTLIAFAHPKVLEHSLAAGEDLAAHARYTARLVIAGLRPREQS